MKKSLAALCAAVISLCLFSCADSRKKGSISFELPENLSEELSLLNNASERSAARDLTASDEQYSLSVVLSGDFSDTYTYYCESLKDLDGFEYSSDEIDPGSKVNIEVNVYYNKGCFYTGSSSVSVVSGENNVTVALKAVPYKLVSFSTEYDYEDGLDYVLITSINKERIKISETYDNGCLLVKHFGDAGTSSYSYSVPALSVGCVIYQLFNDTLGTGYYEKGNVLVKTAVPAKAGTYSPVSAEITSDSSVSDGSVVYQDPYNSCKLSLSDPKINAGGTTAAFSAFNYSVYKSYGSSPVAGKYNAAYQWYKDDAVLENETGTSVEVDNTTAGTFTYKCVVTLTPDDNLKDYCINSGSSFEFEKSVTVKPVGTAGVTLSSLPSALTLTASEDSDSNVTVTIGELAELLSETTYEWIVNGTTVSSGMGKDYSTFTFNKNSLDALNLGDNIIQLVASYEEWEASGNTTITLE